MSERSFRTWFQAVTGLSWRSYVLRRRLAMDPAFPARLEKIKLYGELYMGVIVRDLKPMKAVLFDGFQRNPEDKAKAKLDAWRKENPSKGRRRVFGHNINGDGSTACTPDYAGYRIYCVFGEDELLESIGTSAGAGAAAGADALAGLSAPVTVIESGTFVVTGIEGSFKEDPTGAWIGAGWERMNAMVREKGYRVKNGARWFEEELEPSAPENMRLDLYLEIEK